MPRIEVMNIKFNLDSNQVDAAVHAALCKIPRGKRSGIVKELLYAALCEGKATLQIREKNISPSIGHDYSGSLKSIGREQSEQMEEKNLAPMVAAVGDKRTVRDLKDLDEFRSLIY